MIRFPVFESLTLENYGLYPESYDQPLVFDFLAGPNLIVGVNGSGKTTFISICLRCLIGAFDLPASTTEYELGNVKNKVILNTAKKKIFAQRVADEAVDATAILRFRLGDQVFHVTRSLADLKLVAVNVDGSELVLSEKSDNEKIFQSAISNGFLVSDFFDVLIILRYLTFMMEDRRALVWDSSAQREIFRVLTLPAPRAKEYALARQAIGSADSKYRNTNQSISRLKRSKKSAEKRAKKVVSTEAQRRTKIAEANAVVDKLSKASEERLKLSNQRAKFRLARIKSLEARDNS